MMTSLREKHGHNVSSMKDIADKINGTPGEAARGARSSRPKKRGREGAP
jgi:hypothetical protein